MPLIFFFLQGLFVPNFDDLHYVFLTSNGHDEHEEGQHPEGEEPRHPIMEKYTYDFLNTIGYVSVILVTFLFILYWTKPR